jgi:hypothetical protein
MIAAYDQAGQIAEEKSKKAFSVSAPPVRTVAPVQEVEIEDDDADMALSLARARRLALLQQQRNRSTSC